MQLGQNLSFECQKCRSEVLFSIFEVDSKKSISCSHCAKIYSFSDETLLRQLKKFTSLCSQIRESEEILGNTSVGVNIGDRNVKIPFKLLLTRLNSSLDLRIGDQPLTISFRTEPIKDCPK